MVSTNPSEKYESLSQLVIITIPMESHKIPWFQSPPSGFFGAQKVLATKVPALHWKFVLNKQKPIKNWLPHMLYRAIDPMEFFRWWQWWSQERLLGWSIDFHHGGDPQVMETAEVPICSYIQYIGSLYHLYLYIIYYILYIYIIFIETIEIFYIYNELWT